MLESLGIKNSVDIMLTEFFGAKTTGGLKLCFENCLTTEVLKGHSEIYKGLAKKVVDLDSTVINKQFNPIDLVVEQAERK